MAHLRRRTDGNQREIIDALTQAGWYCLDTSRAGFGAPDLLAVKAWRLVAVEVKDGSQPPNKRKLTPLEADVHAAFKAHGVVIAVIENVEQAVSL